MQGVSALGESGTEGQGEGSEAKPLPEGGVNESESSVSGEGVQAFRGQSVRAGSLDMLVDLDEPEQVMRELKRRADERPGDKRWDTVAGFCQSAINALDALNAAKR